MSDAIAGPAAQPGGPHAEGAGSPAAELLALSAYVCLCGFVRTAADADLAPTWQVKAAMGRLAVSHHDRYRALERYVTATSTQAGAELTTFVPAVDAFHARTSPSDWLEGVLKAYVGAGAADDFLAELAPRVGDAVRPGLTERREDAEELADVLRAELERDPRVRGRLSLWGRRLAGEALSQAQRLGADRPGLFAAVGGDDLASSHPTSSDLAGHEQAAVATLFLRLAEAHIQRMNRLGLAG